MIEVPLGAFAWLGVVMFQAIFYGVLSPRRRKSHAEFELTVQQERVLESIAEEEEEDSNDVNDIASLVFREEFQDDMNGDETPLSVSPCLLAFGGCEGPIEDEPREIFQLLNQTGSELVIGSPQECRSMSFFERLAKEQLQSQETVGGDETAEENLNVRRRVLSTH